MAEPTTTPAPDAAGNATIVFTMEEQLTSSLVLYGLSLLCIVIGGIRSARFVKRMVIKKKPIESSITTKEAKKFPLTASCVLFGLYLFFNPDRLTWSTIQPLLPVPVADFVQPYVEKHSAAAATTFSPSEWKAVQYTRSQYDTYAPPAFKEFVDTAVVPKFDYVPTFSKSNAMAALLFLLCFEGVVALAAIIKPFFSFFLSLLPIGQRRPKLNIPYFIGMRSGQKEMEEGDLEDAKKKDFEYVFKMEFDTHDLVAICFCLPVMISHLYKRHWITNNILGVAFSIYGIENLHLSSFKAGTFLLCGLFIYDVFWVFATDVMTTVAKGIDAPILLQFPQDIYRVGWLEAKKYSMLGLGDIVIPGLFIALLRRFDLRVTEIQAAEGQQKKKDAPAKKCRVYFTITVFAYALGLFVTMGVMHHFKRAQPALLYLVPTCLLIPLLVSVIRGEFSLLWNYNEDHLTDAFEKERREKEKKNK